MAKIGTAHLEIKPVLNDEALEQIAARIEEAVRRGVEAGMASRPIFGEVHISGNPGDAQASIQRTESQSGNR